MGACVGEELPEASGLVLMSMSMTQGTNGESKPKGCGKGSESRKMLQTCRKSGMET